MVARATVPERAATNAVAAVTFDFRGFDTLGEEFILFIAVIGVSILLRTLRSEAREEDKRVEDPGPRGSEFARWLGAGLVGPVAVLAAYIVTHGALTPGGGFQGGAILMAAVTAIFVGGEYAVLLTIRTSATVAGHRGRAWCRRARDHRVRRARRRRHVLSELHR